MASASLQSDQMHEQDQTGTSSAHSAGGSRKFHGIDGKLAELRLVERFKC